ncbi:MULTISPECIES: hypothetical protein [Agrobacterium]|uniref:hypothetical protein n=1 Tax=Agrobacterium TaxID=357 RepID=UPI0009BB8704|nr:MULTISPECIES: hypothetical protein [Agrobacterium]QCL77382.1 hypothetical protein CFBP5499_28395 [Agrobacterium tumefaciens]CUX72321.1 conserved hypothetical protein [Agrobacterium sp. NCPPB 925]
MILDAKFLVGVAVGGVLGIALAPHSGQLGIDFSQLQNTILARATGEGEVTDKGNWPTDEEAKQGLFVLSKWDIKNFGSQSTVIVNRCISIGENTIACEMRAKLSWLKEEALIEGLFRGKPENWTLVSAKTR